MNSDKTEVCRRGEPWNRKSQKGQKPFEEATIGLRTTIDTVESETSRENPLTRNAPLGSEQGVSTMNLKTEMYVSACALLLFGCTVRPVKSPAHIESSISGRISAVRVHEYSVVVDLAISNQTDSKVAVCTEETHGDYSLSLERQDKTEPHDLDGGGILGGNSWAASYCGEEEPLCASGGEILSPHSIKTVEIEVAKADAPYCQGRLESWEIHLALPFRVVPTDQMLIVEIQTASDKTDSSGCRVRPRRRCG